MLKIYIFLFLGFATLSISCSEGDDPQSKMLLKSFDITLDNTNSIPLVTNRNETGNIQMSLFDDNSLEFTITINNLSESDILTAAHVHIGDVVSTGDVEIALVDGMNIAFSGNTANGIITLSNSQISILQGDNVYVNVHSMQIPSGLVRGQIDQTIDTAFNVALSPANEIPMITGRNETGTAHFRLIGTTMFYKVIVNDLDDTDSISAGHIHEGDSSINGAVLINLELTDNSQLDLTKSITLSASELIKINNDALYVNIHSNQIASGLLRGQIR